MTMRITGMNSGLDTESMITALTQTYQDKVDTYTGAQKKLTWKQDKWKSLNSDIRSFYNGTLSTMKFSSAYNKKTTVASNSSAVSIVTGDNAMNTTQKMKVKELATSAYMTGGKLNGSNVTSSTTMADLGYTGDTTELKFGMGKANTDGTYDDYLTVSVSSTDTISDVISKLNTTASDNGVKLNANFDATNGRIYLGAKNSGAANDFNLVSDSGENSLASALGLSSDVATKIKGQDGSIILNDVEYTSSNNVYSVNGLTITANEKTDDEFTLTTKTDTSGIYDNIKKLLSEYNKLVDQFSTLYNADSADSYAMLTDDQRDELSDSEAEDWDNKIKDALLRRDETLYTVMNAFTSFTQNGFSVNVKNEDGSTTSKNLFLSDFGIGTLGYFETDDSNRYELHIDGDSDDSSTSANTDKLNAWIASDPDAVSSFFSQFASGLSNKIFDLMKSTTYSSAFTVYEDKLMASQYSSYTTKISDAQSALESKQDYYYDKFSSMETALSKINSNSSSLSSMLGS